MKLWAVGPELIIGAGCVALVSTAGLVPQRWSRVPLWLAMGVLVTAIVATARMLTWNAVGAFDGTYVVDGLATVFKLAIESAALLTLLLVGDYVRDADAVPHAPVAVTFATAGAVGLCSAADLTLVLLFFQIMSLASYVLTAIDRRRTLGHEAAIKYFVYGAMALAVMAYGLTFLYGMTGSLQLQVIARALGSGDRAWIIAAIAFVIAGYGFEITLVPFHVWSPDVFEGTPAPVAAFLSVVPKIAAMAALARWLAALPVDAPGPGTALAAAAAATMTVGNLAALRQTSLKRLLAYSSIAQAGYVVAALAMWGRGDGAPAAAAFYLFAYVAMNLGAFAIVAAIERGSGRDSVITLNGLGRRAPVPAAVLLIALLSLAGIPPFAGFAGKVLLLNAMIQGGAGWLAIVAAANMAIGVYYYARLAGRLYFDAPAPGASLAGGTAYVNGVSAIVSVVSISAGVMPAPLLTVARYAGRAF